MLDSQGQSRGFGFVAFSTPKNATKAVKEMNGKMIGKKHLYVAMAQSKEERKAILLTSCSSSIIICSSSSIRSGTRVLRFAFIISFGFYRTRGPQQPYFGQGYAGLVRPQPASCGYEQFDFGNRPAMAHSIQCHTTSGAKGEPKRQ
ncbi:hypothetical protein IFM89_020626 [Coptis chinensis]|uniref:RRM domain-containing protein n=1 Tax=Coptis chinensis TaxID=261450 RepID=A0A835IE60_9MAGN|nr:hypothetical protein IFM89_020626 [Coptis chinensis]